MSLPTFVVPGVGTVPAANSGRHDATDSAAVALSNEDLAKFEAIRVIMAAVQAAAENSAPVKTSASLDVVNFTPTIDTAAYGSGDVLFAAVALTVARAVDLRVIISSLTVIDKAKQAADIDLLFYSAAVTSAAANAANNLSDADQLTCLGRINIPAASWKTYTNNSVVTLAGPTAPNLMLEPVTSAQTVYIVGIVNGTPTYGSTSDLVFRFGLIQE